jgi:hypothetical protein
LSFVHFSPHFNACNTKLLKLDPQAKRRPADETGLVNRKCRVVLMTSCTLLWREILDHFLSLEQNILKKSEALRKKIQTLDHQTKASLNDLEKREVTIQGSVEIVLEKVEAKMEAELTALRRASQEDGEVDNGEGLLLSLKSFCLKMDTLGFWRFITRKKKELDALTA